MASTFCSCSPRAHCIYDNQFVLHGLAVIYARMEPSESKICYIIHMKFTIYHTKYKLCVRGTSGSIQYDNYFYSVVLTAHFQDRV